MCGEGLLAVPGTLPTFDDRRTMVMKIESGEAPITTAAFTGLLNRWVFYYPGTPRP